MECRTKSEPFWVLSGEVEAEIGGGVFQRGTLDQSRQRGKLFLENLTPRIAEPLTFSTVSEGVRSDQTDVQSRTLIKLTPARSFGVGYQSTLRSDRGSVHSQWRAEPVAIHVPQTCHWRLFLTMFLLRASFLRTLVARRTNICRPTVGTQPTFAVQEQFDLEIRLGLKGRLKQ